MDTHEPPRGPGPLVTNASITLLCLIWGSTWFVIREGLEDLPPFTSAGARFAVAAAIMFGVSPVLSRREGGRVPPLGLVLVMGLLNFATSYGVVYWSETKLPSGLVALLWAVYPMLMGAIGHLYIPGESLVPRQWLGLAVGFLGVLLLFWTDVAAFDRRAGLVLLVSPLVCAIGTALLRRHARDVSSVMLNRNGMAVGACVLLLVAWTTEQEVEVQWTPRAMLSIGYLALAGTVVTFGLYHWLLRYAPAYRLGLISYVIPVVAITIGWALGGERVTAMMLVGGGMVFAGVALVATRRVPRARRTVEYGAR